MTDDHRRLYLQKKADLGNDLSIWVWQLEEAVLQMDEVYAGVCRQNIDALNGQLALLEMEFARPANRVRVTTRTRP